MTSKSKEIYTLSELAEYSYRKCEQWEDISNVPLPSELVNWIKEGLNEPPIAKKVALILADDVAVSEKCYRFFKLTGAIEQNRLHSLFRSMRIKEIESEKESKILGVKEEIQERIYKRREEARNENIAQWVKWGAITGLVIGYIGAFVWMVMTGNAKWIS